MVAQTYTLTATSKDYSFVQFTTDPAACPITYSIFSIDASLDQVVTFDSDESSRLFQFSYGTDLVPLAGEAESKDFTIVIEASTGVTSVQSIQESFSLKLMNPCVDTSFVELVTPNVHSTQIDYELYSGNVNEYFHVFESFEVI
jgi:hypothetical protein